VPAELAQPHPCTVSLAAVTHTVQLTYHATINSPVVTKCPHYMHLLLSNNCTKYIYKVYMHCILHTAIHEETNTKIF